MFGCAEKGSPAGERFHAAECWSLSLGERVRVRGKGALGRLRHVKTRGALSEILVALGGGTCATGEGSARFHVVVPSK